MGTISEMPVSRAQSGFFRTSWECFIRQARQDIIFWLFSLSILSAFRVIFIIIFRSLLSDKSGLADLGMTLYTGIRYDLVVSTYITFLPLLFSVLSGFMSVERLAERVRKALAIIYVIASASVFVVTIEYFREYNSQFSNILLNFIYDDTGAIISTIAKEYNPLVNLTAVAILSVVGIWGILKLIGSGRPLPYWAQNATTRRKAVITIVLIALMFFSSRGTFGTVPLRGEVAAKTSDRFLNQSIFNPYYAGYSTVRDFHRIKSDRGIRAFIPNEDIAGAMRFLFHKNETPATIDSELLKTVSNSGKIHPKHIFVFVIESFDRWALMDKYAFLGLADELKRIASSGVMLDVIPNGELTSFSIASMVSGIPRADLDNIIHPLLRKHYPTSMAPTFARLGYRTRFFYGGILSWHGIEDFLKAQGFDEIYGAPDIQGTRPANEWGVDDNDLFDFVLSRMDEDRPTFNIVLSTNYHPPFDKDVYGNGWNVRSLPPAIEGEPVNPKTDLRVIGHLRYEDKALGRFYDAIRSRDVNFLMAVTGDHPSRKSVMLRPTLYEQSVIPLVIAGTGFKRDEYSPACMTGRHLDIAPTLIELIAPEGFVYHSFGRNVLSPDQGPCISVGDKRLITADVVLDPISRKIEPIPGRVNVPEQDMGNLIKIYNYENGVAWWRVFRGNEIKR